MVKEFTFSKKSSLIKHRSSAFHPGFCRFGCLTYFADQLNCNVWSQFGVVYHPEEVAKVASFHGWRFSMVGLFDPPSTPPPSDSKQISWVPDYCRCLLEKCTHSRRSTYASMSWKHLLSHTLSEKPMSTTEKGKIIQVCKWLITTARKSPK